MNAIVEFGGFGELCDWQAMLDRHREVFTEMDDGARIGIVSREASGILPGKHLEGVQRAAEVDMLAWEVQGGGMQAGIERFAGMATVKVDLLLVADAEALAAARADLAGNALTTIKKAIRRGNIMFFVFKNKAQLQDAGYEDFLESLGLAFLGACR
ncbi:MAG: hypothetical protein IPH41_04490 [Sulfuritalea sp.]|jgi:hypothetical protein|nr:hypothetical protein [Sulfuritalea sp.]MBP8898444.1 hypothetical protein [Sulfuritalea sp.]